MKGFLALLAALVVMTLSGCSGDDAPEGVSGSIRKDVRFVLDTDGAVERNVSYSFTDGATVLHDDEFTASEGMEFQYGLYAPTIPQDKTHTLTVVEKGHPDASKSYSYDGCKRGYDVAIKLRGTSTATVSATCRT